LSSSSDTVVLPALTSKCNPHHNRDPVIVYFHIFSRETQQVTLTFFSSKVGRCMVLDVWYE